MKLLDGKIALVTGGGRGIGEAIAIEFATNGAKVAIASRSLEELNGAKKKIEKIGGECLVVRADITSRKDITDMFEKTVKKFGKIDILVNNAGVLFDYGPFMEMKDKNIDKMVGINLLGTIHCTKEVVPHMKRNGSGLIVNISSVAGKHGFADLAVYCATKFGVIGFTESLAQELEDEKIAVYAICPAATQTKMWEQISDKKAEHVPEDVALEIMDLIKNMKKIPGGKAIDVRKHV